METFRNKNYFFFPRQGFVFLNFKVKFQFEKMNDEDYNLYEQLLTKNFLEEREAYTIEDNSNIMESFYSGLLEEGMEAFYTTLSFEDKIQLSIKYKKVHELLQKKDLEIKRLSSRIVLSDLFPVEPPQTQQVRDIINTFKPKMIVIDDYFYFKKCYPEDFLKSLSRHKFKEIKFIIRNKNQTFKYTNLKTDTLKISSAIKLQNITAVFCEIIIPFSRIKKIEMCNCVVNSLMLSLMKMVHIEHLVLKDVIVKHIINFYLKEMTNLKRFEYNIVLSFKPLMLKENPDIEFVNLFFENVHCFKKLYYLEITVPQPYFSVDKIDNLRNALKLKRLILLVELHQTKYFYLNLRDIFKKCKLIRKIRLQSFCKCPNRDNSFTFKDMKKLFNKGKKSKRIVVQNIDW